MRNIPAIIVDLVTLLAQYGYHAEAQWLDEKRTEFVATQDGNRRRETMKQLHKILAGMGSLSDIHLTPLESSGVSKAEANRKLFELIIELDEATETALDSEQS